jgi:hypothetical protein
MRGMGRKESSRNCDFPFSHFSLFPFPYTRFIPVKRYQKTMIGGAGTEESDEPIKFYPPTADA